MRQAAQNFEKSLAQAENRVDHARTTFDSLDKAKLRAVLYREQHHLCIYCERCIEEGVNTPPVEHWRPLAKEPESALAWENLYLSCPTVGTCDDAKRGRKLAWDEADPSLPWPTQAEYERWVGFTSGGEIYVRAGAPISAEQRRALELAIENREDGGLLRHAILNLNDPALVAARKAAIDSEKSRLRSDFAGRTATGEDRSKIATGLLSAASRRSFVSIRVAYVERTLGRGRP